MAASVRFLWFAVLFLAVLCPYRVAQSQPPLPANPPSSSRNEPVVLDVLVQQRDTGRIIVGLEKADFTVFEDGLKQEVTQFSREDLPLSIVMLLDLSRSMDMVIKRIREGSRPAWQHLRAEDEVAVMGFAKEVKVLQGFTRNQQIIAEQIEKTYAEVADLGKMNTYIDEAVYQAASYLRTAANPNYRRVLVVVSDDQLNQETGHSHKDALKELLTSGTIVYGLVLTASGDSLAFDRSSIVSYTQQTGGRVLSVGSSLLAYPHKLEIHDKLVALLESLHGRYRLTYVPADAKPHEKFRRIKVKISAPIEKRTGKLDVLSRSGYYPAGEPPKRR